MLRSTITEQDQFSRECDVYLEIVDAFVYASIGNVVEVKLVSSSLLFYVENTKLYLFRVSFDAVEGQDLRYLAYLAYSKLTVLQREVFLHKNVIFRFEVYVNGSFINPNEQPQQ